MSVSQSEESKDLMSAYELNLNPMGQVIGAITKMNPIKMQLRPAFISDLIDIMRPYYEAIGVNIEDLHSIEKNDKNEYILNQESVPAGSDIYFLAQMMDKLTIEIGEIDFLEEESVVLKGGKKIKSNVLLKCIGIKTDSTIIPTIFGENSIIDGFWINKDPNLFTYSDGESFSNALTNVKSLLCGSYLFFVQAFTPAYIYYRKNPEKMKSLILKLTNTEFNNNKISILFTEMWDYIEEAKKNNQIHVLEECSIERFLTETEIE